MVETLLINRQATRGVVWAFPGLSQVTLLFTTCPARKYAQIPVPDFQPCLFAFYQTTATLEESQDMGEPGSLIRESRLHHPGWILFGLIVIQMVDKQ